MDPAGLPCALLAEECFLRGFAEVSVVLELQPLPLAYWVDLGLIDYVEAFAIQEKVLEARLALKIPAVTVVQENPPTFTVGRSGQPDEILLGREELQRKGIAVVEVNRGGGVTYHGPGQVVVSPVLNLRKVRMNANQYLHVLEDVLIEVLARYGIYAERKPGYPGVWVKGAKIASIGLAVRHFYAFHGFSLNVNVDLEPFQWIVPCGLRGMPVTSMQQLLDRTVPIAEVKDQLRDCLGRRLGLQFQEATWPELQREMEALKEVTDASRG